MKRVFITILTFLLLMSPGFSMATQVYDESKTITRNQVDALIAIANASGQEVSLSNVLVVDGNRTDSYTENGTMAAPYKTIAAANAVAVSGDVLLVAPGAYAETVTITAGAMLFGWNVTGATLTGEYFIHYGATVEFSGNLVMENAETIDNAVDGTIALNGDVYLNGAVRYKAARIIPADDVTPSVAASSFMITSANTGATAITDLDDPVVGSVVWIIGGSDTNSSTIADAGNFNLSAAWTAALDDMLCLYVQADDDYIECGRVDN